MVSSTPVKILTIGSATQDVFLIDHDDFTTTHLGSGTVFSKLTLGRKVTIDRAVQVSGGGGTNAAVTFARAGFEVSFIGSIGDDLAGQAVLADLERDGIDTGYVRARKGIGTGYSVLLLAPNGERTALIVKGASKTFAGIDFAKIIASEKPDWLYVTTLAGDMKSLATIFEAAVKHDVRVFFNPGDSEIENIAELLPLLQMTDILSVNTEEADKLLRKMRKRGGWKKYIQLGLAFGAKCAVISDGEHGAYLATAQNLYKVGLYDSQKSVDRTGAGDAFGSGFLAEYIRTEDIHKALVFASANSSSVVEHIGAKDGILPAKIRLHDMPIKMTRLGGKK
jgi:ribokinase